MHLVIWSLVIPHTDTTPTQTNFRVIDFVCQIWKFLGCLNPWWREQIKGHYQIYPKYSDNSTHYHTSKDIWTSQFTPSWLNKSVYSLLIEQASLLPVGVSKIDGWVANSVETDQRTAFWSGSALIALACMSQCLDL